MKEAFVFDVDGTLTPIKGKIDEEFKNWLLQFCRDNSVILVTGSDRAKTLDQIGKDLYDSCVCVYQCNGNEMWVKNYLSKKNSWRVPYDVEKHLNNVVNRSRYPYKVGRHIEQRTGMINFSVIGRQANEEQRKHYYEWDKEKQERRGIAQEFNRMFKDLHASVGGMISIDIHPRTCDKAQVVEDLKDFYDRVCFFGDRTEFGGNDFGIALLIELGDFGKVYRVKHWQETWKGLKEYVKSKSQVRTSG